MVREPGVLDPRDICLGKVSSEDLDFLRVYFEARKSFADLGLPCAGCGERRCQIGCEVRVREQVQTSMAAALAEQDEEGDPWAPGQSVDQQAQLKMDRAIKTVRGSLESLRAMTMSPYSSLAEHFRLAVRELEFWQAFPCRLNFPS